MLAMHWSTKTTASSSHTWCDPSDGIGPFAPDSHALTSCFCASTLELFPPVAFVLLGIPALIKLRAKPFVNPASSRTFAIKLGLSAIATFCAAVLAGVADPQSTANIVAQSLTVGGWVVSMFMLLAGYRRALPQRLLLRAWWLTEFAAGLIVFWNHSTQHPRVGVNVVRGVGLGCVSILAVLSCFPEDVPRYEDVLVLNSPTPVDGRLAASASLSDLSVLYRSVPLTRSVSSASEDRRFGMASNLSQSTLFGADSSAFKGPLAAWNEAVANSLQSPLLENQVDAELAESSVHSRY